MFIQFFYTLRDRGVPVTPTSFFLRLQRALSLGLVTSLDDFYTVARSLLVKSERYFDLYDKVFLHTWGVELKDPGPSSLPTSRGPAGGVSEGPQGWPALRRRGEGALQAEPRGVHPVLPRSVEGETEAHHGGSHGIGTRGTSPVGHSGYHPEEWVGGVSRNKSAVKVAMDRRWRDYSQDGPLTQAQMGEALKRLRRMVPAGPKDLVNVDKTIRETLRNAGEIEIVFDRRLTDRLKVILLIDNGGWSMEPYVELVQTLFSYARSQFKDVRTYYFHNSVYDVVWQDAQRFYRPERLDEFAHARPRDATHRPGRCEHVALRAHVRRGRHRLHAAKHPSQHRPAQVPGRPLPPCRLAQPLTAVGVGARSHHRDDPPGLPHVRADAGRARGGSTPPGG